MGLVHRGKISGGHRVRARDLRLAGQLAKPAARRRGRAHFLHEIPSVQRAAPRRGVLQHALAKLASRKGTSSFTQYDFTSSKPSPATLDSNLSDNTAGIASSVLGLVCRQTHLAARLQRTL